MLVISSAIAFVAIGCALLTEVVAEAKPLPSFARSEGAIVLPVEDLEGALLLHGELRNEFGRDTSGLFVLDTGAGFLALDHELAVLLGVSDAKPAAEGVQLAPRPLSRLTLGGLRVDQVAPILTFDAGVVRRATDRTVLGLLGQKLFEDRALVIDYREGVAVLLADGATTGPRRAGPGMTPAGADGRTTGPRPIKPGVEEGGSSHSSPEAGASSGVSVPPDRAAGLASAPGSPRDSLAAVASRIATSRALVACALSSQAIPIPFRLVGDGRIVLRASLEGGTCGEPAREVTLIVDTGATKSVFFEESLESLMPGWRHWPAVRGLLAPTLMGDAPAAIVRVPALRILSGPAGGVIRGMDAAVVGGGLGAALSRDIGEPVAGLLGYTFLRNYRVAFDFTVGILWLDPAQGAVSPRRDEYSHVGIQLEREGPSARVVAVADGSPAAKAGIRAGDELVSIDGRPSPARDIIALSRALEGPPGSRVSLVLARGGRGTRYRLTRRQLL